MEERHMKNYPNSDYALNKHSGGANGGQHLKAPNTGNVSESGFLQIAESRSRLRCVLCCVKKFLWTNML
jgi:hypothetical protein